MTTTTNNEIITNQTKQTIATHDSTTQTTCKEELLAMVSAFATIFKHISNTWNHTPSVVAVYTDMCSNKPNLWEDYSLLWSTKSIIQWSKNGEGFL